MSKDINRIALMVRIDDAARADIALTPERSYYRFATDSSIEDGELAAVADFQVAATAIIDAYMPHENEHPLPSDMRLQLFVNNRLAPEIPTDQSLDRIIDTLIPLHPEFTFLSGFKA